MIKKIESLLLQLQSPAQGNFSAKQVSDVDDLSITIKDLGKLKLPITPRKAKQLIKHAKPAKYGLKDQTLLDKSVRDCWEIPKSHIKIDKRLWKKSFDGALQELKLALGLSEDAQLKAQLHNLLIYEPGQFFKPHQDSEKCDNMVATLVVVLPSDYKGGTLIIDHKGEKHRITSRQTPADKATFIAFYADCHHEVKPVTDGYRLTLTYNLFLQDDNNAFSSEIDSAVVNELSEAVSDYFSLSPVDNGQVATDKIQFKKLAYLLDHEYTEKGLHWSRLKGLDRVRVKTLQEVAKTQDLELRLSLVDVHESRECWEEDRNDWGGRYNYGWDEFEDDDVEEESDEDQGLEVGDLLFSEYDFKYSLDLQGKHTDISGIRIREDDICWTKATDDLQPFESEYEGYMGNWGNTMDKWYHRAALVLWRKTDNYLMLLEASPYAFVDEMISLAASDESRAKAEKLITKLMPNWSTDRRVGNFPPVFQLALLLKNSELAKQLMQPLDKSAVNKDAAIFFVKLADQYGLAWLIDVLKEWLYLSNRWEQDKPQLLESILPIVKKIHKTKSKNRAPINTWLLKHQLLAIQYDLDANCNEEQQAELNRTTPHRINTAQDLIEASIHADEEAIVLDLIEYIVSSKRCYPVLALSEMLGKLKGSDNKASISKLRDYLRAEIEIALNKKPRNKDDWSISTNSRCSCEDCKKLNGFLLDGKLQVLVWPLAKARRQHVHQTIDAMCLPVSHITERKGSPHKLILTKTEKLFSDEKALRERYQQARLSKGMGGMKALFDAKRLVISRR